MEESVPEGRKEPNATNTTYNAGDIRNFGKLGTKTDTSKDFIEDEYVDKEEMNRKGRMNMMRNKLRLTRKKFDRRPVETDLHLKEHKVKAKTLKGLRILHASKVANEEVQDDNIKIVVGADVEGLYPALQDMEVANICYQAVLNTSIKFNNIDYRKGSIYVAMNMTEEERNIHPLGRVLPWRRSKTGSRPWVTGVMKNAEDSWIIPNKGWTELEKKILVAEMVRIGVIVMMNTHLFRWDGRMFLQRKGGPIGLRVTCCVARITMLHWDGKLLEKLKKNNVKLDEGARYMDDIRAILSGLREGWRWVEDG